MAAGSAIGLLVYAGIDVRLFESLTGTAGILSTIPVLLLVALALAGLVIVIVDTSLIHRADAAVQAKARGRVSHHPVYAHAHRYPPHHRGSWVFAIFALAGMTAIAAIILPAEVNSWAYVVGAESHGTFTPASYRQACTAGVGRFGGSCNMVTEGYLSDGDAQVSWGTTVPLGRPFAVRDPVWAWASGRSLISGDGSAIPTIFAGLFFDGVTALLVYVLLVLVRGTSPDRSQWARAGPGRRGRPAASR